ncbi:MAG: FAD-dependent oxidoreductase [Candidatus Acidoferrales bacterium]
MGYDYDMVVIGGGAAGLTAAGISATLGAKTALIEKAKLGGDCTWTGCVPSKTLLRAAKVAHTFRTADRYGLPPATPQVRLAEVMRHVREIQNQIYEEVDAPPNLESLGVTVLHARAWFRDPHTVSICEEEAGKERQLTSRYFVVAAGSVAAIPPVDGLDRVDYLTNETLFSLTELPRRLIVVGAGPLGTEMAQAFRRLGSEVVVVAADPVILPRDDGELSEKLKEALMGEGIVYQLGAFLKKVEQSGGRLRVTAERDGQALTVEGDAVLISIGRRPKVEGLHLDAAGVEFDKKGIKVNGRCRTTTKNIYAAGDVASPFQFTHMAEHMAKVAVSNALLKLPLRVDSRHVPWCTYTEPELAHVGAREAELKERGVSYAVYRFPFARIDRAVTDSETTGLIKVFARRLTGKIYGVSILGANAGEMIGEYAVALRNGVRLRQIADTIHPYPTYVLGNRRAADQWYVQKFSPTLVRWLQRLFGYRGRVLSAADLERLA